jgi:hypothetical protein
VARMLAAQQGTAADEPQHASTDLR